MLAWADHPATGEARDDYSVVLPAPSLNPSHSQIKRRPRGSAHALIFETVRETGLPSFIETCSPFLPRSVYARLAAGEGDFAGEHRHVTSMFVGFAGVRYDNPVAGEQLQAYFRAAPGCGRAFDGHLNRVLTGDKGSVLHILFGAPDAHEDDLFRALRCALALQAQVARLPFITGQRIASRRALCLPDRWAARRDANTPSSAIM